MKPYFGVDSYDWTGDKPDIVAETAVFDGDAQGDADKNTNEEGKGA
jgi:hypothetical protein